MAMFPQANPQFRTRSQRAATIPTRSQGFRALLEQLRSQETWARLGIVLAGLLLSWALSEPWKLPFSWRAGFSPQRDVVASVSFTTVDEQATRSAQLAQERQVPYIFRNDPTPLKQLREQLESLLEQMASLKQAPEFFRDFLPALKADGAAWTPEEVQSQFEKFKQVLKTEPARRVLQAAVAFALAPYEARGILDALPESPPRFGGLEKRDELLVFDASAANPSESMIRASVPEVTLGEGQRLAERLSSKAEAIDTADKLFAWLRRRLPKTTLVYEQARTEAERQKAVESVAPIKFPYRVGSKLAEAGKPLRPQDVGLLRLEWRARQDALSFNAVVERSLAWLAMFLLVFFPLGYYAVQLEPKIWQKLDHLAAVSLGIPATLLAVRALSGDSARAEIIPILLAGMLAGIAYRQTAAVLLTASLCIIAVTTLGQGAKQMIVMLAGSALAIGLVRPIRSRKKLIVVGAAVGAVIGALTIAVGLLDGQPIADLYSDAARNCLWALVTGFLLTGLLPFLEGRFLLTDIKLLELGDASHPLLQELVQRAPGTYNHSINVAFLAEAAAEAIEANGLLVRVGAYFHDIGKMFKPDYFVENQTPGQNRHDSLPPAMSTLIIIAHVKDGADLAERHRLPQPIVDFIEQHHGTTLVQFFYDRANQAGGGQVEESAFRYPGPKPQTKEAAVLMITDAVESASRTLAEPTATRLRNLVHSLAMKRLMDGQFDECGLTLSELKEVEDSLVKSLIAMYHGRVKYQDANKSDLVARPAAARAAG